MKARSSLLAAVQSAGPSSAAPECLVAIADDHPLVASGLARLVDSVSGFRSEWISHTIADVWERLEGSPVDLLLADIEMPGMAILTFLRRVRRLFPSTKVLVVSALPSVVYAERVIRAGSSGFLSKSDPADQMLLALRRAADGEVWRSPQSRGKSPSPGVQALSPRELEIFEMLAAGLSPRDVGSTIGISHRTVATHRLRIYRKLGISSLGELVRLGVEHARIES